MKQTTWQQELKRLKLEDIRRRSPAFFEASGGFESSLAPAYTDKSANSLTKCIVDFLNYKKHHATRVNTQGQVRTQDIPRYNIYSGQMVSVGKKVTYTKSTTRKGTADIIATIKGRSVHIEVKTDKDKMSDDQIREKGLIEEAGGVYFLAKNFPDFLEFYDELTR